MNQAYPVRLDIRHSGTARLRRDDCGVSGKENNCYTDYTTKTLWEDNQYEQALPTHGVLSDFFDVTKNSASIFEASEIGRAHV